jgi:hypothetical protein
MTKQDTKAQTKSRSIPNCRVVEIGLGDFAECTEWRAVHCSHSLPFGYCFLCMHPRVENMIENTKKALQAAKI